MKEPLSYNNQNRTQFNAVLVQQEEMDRVGLFEPTTSAMLNLDIFVFKDSCQQQASFATLLIHHYHDERAVLLTSRLRYGYRFNQLHQSHCVCVYPLFCNLSIMESYEICSVERYFLSSCRYALKLSFVGATNVHTDWDFILSATTSKMA